MKQRWPLRSSIDDGHPIIPGNTPFPHSGPFSPPNLPAHDEPFDYKAQLAANEAAIERMKQCWPLPLQPMAQALSEPPTPRDTSASSSSPRQPTSITSTTTMPSALRAMVPQPDSHHRPTVVPSPKSAAQPSAAAKDELNDPTLLDAATALDNFLIQYPRKLNLPANIPYYQPSPHGPSLCCHTLLAQQTAVLRTINVILSELCEKVTRFIAAATINTAPSRPLCIPSNPTVFHSPQNRIMKPDAGMSPLLLLTWPSKTLAPHLLQLPPVNKLTNYQISIPATLPTTCAFNMPRQLQTKDHLRPP